MRQLGWEHVIYVSILIFSVIKLLGLPLTLVHIAFLGDQDANPVFSNFNKEMTFFFARDLGMAALTTLLVAGFSILLILILALPAAYAFVAFKFPGKSILWALIIVLLFLPARLAVVNVAESLRTIGISEPLLIMVICFAAELLPFAILLGTFFIRSLPNVLFKWESLYLQNEFIIFWHAVVPLIAPWAISVALTSLYVIWGDVWTPTLVAGKPVLFVATFIDFLSQNNMPGQNLFVVILPALIPSVIIYVAFIWQLRMILKLK